MYRETKIIIASILIILKKGRLLVHTIVFQNVKETAERIVWFILGYSWKWWHQARLDVSVHIYSRYY